MAVRSFFTPISCAFPFQFSDYDNDIKQRKIQINPRLKIKLGYRKDSNAAAHSVDSDIFYAVIQ